MRAHALLVTLSFLLAAPLGCRRALTITPPIPPDVSGRVLGHTYETQPRGLGGLSQGTVALYSDEARAFTRARLWVDSLTKCEGRARDSVDWRLPTTC